VSEANGKPESHYGVWMVFVDMICMPLIFKFIEAVVLDEPTRMSHFYHSISRIKFFWQCSNPEPVGGRALFFLSS